METTRRRFLFGLGATGVLIATPLPIAGALEASRAPRPLIWRARLEVVGELTFSDRPSSEALPFDAFELRGFSYHIPSIDVTSCDSVWNEYVPGPPESWLEIEGQIDPAIENAMQAGSRIPVCFPLPSRAEWISAEVFVQQLTTVVR